MCDSAAGLSSSGTKSKRSLSTSESMYLDLNPGLKVESTVENFQSQITLEYTQVCFLWPNSVDLGNFWTQEILYLGLISQIPSSLEQIFCSVLLSSSLLKPVLGMPGSFHLNCFSDDKTWNIALQISNAFIWKMFSGSSNFIYFVVLSPLPNQYRLKSFTELFCSIKHMYRYFFKRSKINLKQGILLHWLFLSCYWDFFGEFKANFCTGDKYVKKSCPGSPDQDLSSAFIGGTYLFL